MPPKKRLSKKSKSDWRKNVDVRAERQLVLSDATHRRSQRRKRRLQLYRAGPFAGQMFDTVQARREQIHGGAPEQKADSDLFFVDRVQTSARLFALRAPIAHAFAELTKKEAARAKALFVSLLGFSLSLCR